MAEFFDTIDARHRAFIAKQPVFFVATAADGARINLSPKGMDCFRVVDDRTVAWLLANPLRGLGVGLVAVAVLTGLALVVGPPTS